jgi:hypothetical protein
MRKRTLLVALAGVAVVGAAVAVVLWPQVEAPRGIEVMQAKDEEESAAIGLALTFTRALVAGEFESAHRMLAPSRREELQPADLRAEYEGMTAYWYELADGIQSVAIDDKVTLWPEPKSRRGLRVYVPIMATARNGSVFQEAVAVRVVNRAGSYLIDDVVWGRP